MTKVANSTYEKRLQNTFHKVESGEDNLKNKFLEIFSLRQGKRKTQNRKIK